MSTPLSTSRKIDLTLWGFHRNQQALIAIQLFLLSIVYFMISFTFNTIIAYKVSIVFLVVECVFFTIVGSNAAVLYHFECACRFLISISNGMNFIEKHGENGDQKARDLTHIQKVHDKGYIQYHVGKLFHQKRSHNWGVMLELKGFQPDDLDQFALNLERVLISLPDKTLIKTFLHVRSDLTDYAEPLRDELRRNRIPQIVRDSMFEFQLMCEEADAKSFENHMLILLDYTASATKAKDRLDIIVKTVQEILDDMEIGSRVLKTEDEILNMFYGHITYNIHQGA
jgi:hypothetical protein